MRHFAVRHCARDRQRSKITVDTASVTTPTLPAWPPVLQREYIISVSS